MLLKIFSIHSFQTVCIPSTLRLFSFKYQYYHRKYMIYKGSKRFIKKERNLLEKFSFCKGKKLLSSLNFKVHQYQVEKYFIFIKMKGLEVKLLGKRKKILTNMSYLLQRSLFYRFSFKKKGILNVSILHKFNVWHIITKKECQKKGKKYLNEKER